MERFGIIRVVGFLTVLIGGYGVEAAGGFCPDNRCLLEDEQQQPYRTVFHFQPQKNWMNDPNGPMYYNGVYHLFYQYNPYAAIWGNITWAHSVSYNLVDWIHLDHALVPDKPYDVKGCWSGSATILPGIDGPVILYTGENFAGQQVQNLAAPKNLSDPFLSEWVKSPHNPVMSPIHGIDPKNFRDPTTAWRGLDGMWRVIIGSQIDGHGAAILYKSSDFVTWIRAARLLHASNKTGMWECPDFYPVSGNVGLDTSVNGASVVHVLKASTSDHDYYLLGTYDSGMDGFSVGVDFMDDSVQLRYDYGVFYASKSFYDPAKKRRILWGWVTEAGNKADDNAKGWSGLQSIPRTILLDKSGKQLIQWPIEEVKKLRGKKVTIKNQDIKMNVVYKVKGITPSQADVMISFTLQDLEGVEPMDEDSRNPELLCARMNSSVNGAVGPFGLLVLASDDLAEYTAVFFRVLKHHNEYVVLMCSDQSRSSLKTPVKEPIFGAFLNVDPHHKISLRTLIDHSIVESFGGHGKSCITARVYPTAKNSHIYLFNKGTKSITVSSLAGWSMKRAYVVMAHRRRRKPSLTIMQ